MRHAKNVACKEENKNALNILMENLKENGHLGDLGVDGRLILKRILNKMWDS